MRAAIFNGVGKPVTIDNIPDPTPGPGDVVVKVGRCGICGTDVHMTASHGFAPPPGTALGHEFSGEVVALGAAVNNLRVGDNIAVMPMAGCGTCTSCRAGHPFACSQMRMMMGGFGEYALANAAVAVKLPSALSLTDGALVEPLAAALHGVKMSHPTRDSKILVLGLGGMGLASIYWARHLGAGKIVASARSPWREAMALELGADAFVVSNDELAARAAEALGGPPDIVIECVGMPGILAQAMNLVRPRGMVLSVGGGLEADQLVPFVGMYKEICLQFAGAYSLDDFHEVVDALDRGALALRGLVTDTLSLDAMPAMLESLRGSNRQCKVMINPWMT